MANNNNLNNNRGNSNNRNYGHRHFNDRDNNNRKRNNSSESSKPTNTFLFSKGNVLDLIRKLPLIKNKMRVENVYSIFYGKAKSFTVSRPRRLFTYNGPGVATQSRPSKTGSSDDSSSDGDSSGDEDYKTPKSSISDGKVKISKNHRRLSTIAFEDSELVPDIDDLDDIDLNMADIYIDDEIVSFSDYRRGSRKTIREKRTSNDLPDDEFDDDGGGGGDGDQEEDGDNSSKRSSEPPQELYQCQNYMEYIQCMNSYRDELKEYRKRKKQFKEKFNLARKFLIDYFGGAARDTMAPFLQKSSDKYIRAAYRAFLNSVVSKSSSQDIKDILIELNSIPFDSKKQDIISFHSRFHSIITTLHSLNQGVSTTMHHMYWKQAIEKDHSTRWEPAFDKAETTIELKEVTSYWDKHKILLKSLIELEKKLKAKAKHQSDRDKEHKAAVAKFESRQKKEHDNSNKSNYNNNVKGKEDNKTINSSYSKLNHHSYVIIATVLISLTIPKTITLN